MLVISLHLHTDWFHLDIHSLSSVVSGSLSIQTTCSLGVEACIGSFVSSIGAYPASIPSSFVLTEPNIIQVAIVCPRRHEPQLQTQPH
jgi:hypothetical protein